MKWTARSLQPLWWCWNSWGDTQWVFSVVITVREYQSRNQIRWLQCSTSATGSWAYFLQILTHKNRNLANIIVNQPLVNQNGLKVIRRRLRCPKSLPNICPNSPSCSEILEIFLLLSEFICENVNSAVDGLKINIRYKMTRSLHSLHVPLLVCNRCLNFEI